MPVDERSLFFRDLALAGGLLGITAAEQMRRAG